MAVNEARGRSACGAAWGVAWLLLAAVAAAQSVPLEDLDRFPRQKLEIVSGRERHVFDVWVASTPARQAQGLMFVRDLPADRGMLFVYEAPQQLSMWMKNTYIPLDMVFIDGRGRIAHIAAQTEPHSLRTIAAPGPVQYVLELRGGEAQRRGLQVGDQVQGLATPHG